MKNIAIIDIDGCLNDYPNTLVLWINHHAGTTYESLDDIINVSKKEFDKYKDEYRSSGIQENFKLKSDVKKSIKKLKENGYCITILTARNHYKYNNISRMTINWLYKNNMYFDQIVFESDKLKYISTIHNYVAIVIDDDKKLIQSLNDKYPDIKSIHFSNYGSSPTVPFSANSWAYIYDKVILKMPKTFQNNNKKNFITIPDSVVIIPFSENSMEIGILNHYRETINAFMFEFVAGKIQEKEQILDACHRELKEESNIDTINDNLIFIGIINPYPGISSERHFVFIAKVDSFSAEFETYDDEDKIYFSKISIDKLKFLIDTNLITDSKTISSFNLLSGYIDKSKKY
ncbi:MAG: hypothetical protein CMI96_01210 [Pelagibacteraceae bacterium]|nr:hypothetical protein [Pelagibacteraceae bacterium]